MKTQVFTMYIYLQSSLFLRCIIEYLVNSLSESYRGTYCTFHKERQLTVIFKAGCGPLLRDTSYCMWKHKSPPQVFLPNINSLLMNSNLYIPRLLVLFILVLKYSDELNNIKYNTGQYNKYLISNTSNICMYTHTQIHMHIEKSGTCN